MYSTLGLYSLPQLCPSDLMCDSAFEDLILVIIIIICMSNQVFEHHATTDWDPINLEVELPDCNSPLQTRTLKMQSRSVYVQMYG